jgi:outer membrane receptor protein involved in Fe transport
MGRWCTVAGAVSLALARAAGAADAPPAQPQGVLTEISVTASKRGEQSVQDVPAAIQALGGEDLAASGAVSFQDFAGRVPSLSYQDLGPGDKKYVIRGITSSGPATVGVYYDEAVITAANAEDGGGRNADIALFDLDRVEVLKGPQGTLYGASSMSGTIRYITKKPVLDAFEGHVGAEYSNTTHGGDNYTINGTINLPIVDGRLALRATGWNVDYSGFIDMPRLPAGPKKGVNDSVTRGGRVTLRWQATDDLSVLATATTQTLTSGGSSRYTPPGATSFGNAAAGYPPVQGGDLVNTDLALSPWSERIKIFGITAEYTTHVGTLTATSNYFDRPIDYAFDSSPILFYFGVPIPGITLQPQERRIVSNEIRWASKLDGPVNFVAGAFNQDEKSDFSVAVVKTNAFGLANGPFSTSDADDALSNPNGNTFFGRYNNKRIKQYAAFGELTWQATDALSATLGVRYFHSKQTQVQETTHPFGGFGGTAPTGPLYADPRTDSKTTFKGNVAYKLADKSLVYVTASQGFRVGGTNSADIPFAQDIPRNYAPDSLWNYEIGAKTELLGGKLRLDGAVFVIDWKDIQVTGNDATGAFKYTTNAGKARVNGLEFSADAVLAEGLVASLNGSYTDAKLKSDQTNEFPASQNPSLGRSGDRLFNVPKFQGSLSLDWKRPVAAATTLDLRADVTYRGSTQTQFNDKQLNGDPNPFNVQLAAYTLVNLRAGIEHGPWTASVFAQNVTDKRAQVDAISSNQDPLARLTVRPRTIGLSINRSF